MNEKARQMWQKITPDKFRKDMTPLEEIHFINDMYDCYEAEDDFCPIYYSVHGRADKYHGQPYQLLERVKIPSTLYSSLQYRNESFDSEIVNYPMWMIKFADGETFAAFETEIIARCIRENNYIIFPEHKSLSFEEIKRPLDERNQSLLEEKEYIVKRYYQSTVTVKASSPEEALDKAGDYEGSLQLLDEDEVEEVVTTPQMRM